MHLFHKVSTCRAEALLAGGEVVPGLRSGAEVEVEGTFSWQQAGETENSITSSGHPKSPPQQRSGAVTGEPAASYASDTHTHTNQSYSFQSECFWLSFEDRYFLTFFSFILKTVRALFFLCVGICSKRTPLKVFPIELFHSGGYNLDTKRWLLLSG